MAGRTGPGLIGGVGWTLKNFDTTTFRNGDSIPQITNNVTWANTTSPGWCYYNNDPETALYTVKYITGMLLEMQED